jgi:ADP-ribose pyrophosphatase YjhB (NUDIX family)
MAEQNFYRVSVKGIVVDAEGRLLLSREDNDMWDTLGGGLDHDEDPLDGLRREVFEESGMRVTWISPTPKYFTTSKRHKSEGYAANVVYEMKLDDAEHIPSSESVELKFFTPDEARKLNLYPATRKLVELYDQDLHA